MNAGIYTGTDSCNLDVRPCNTHDCADAYVMYTESILCFYLHSACTCPVRVRVCCLSLHASESGQTHIDLYSVI